MEQIYTTITITTITNNKLSMKNKTVKGILSPIMLSGLAIAAIVVLLSFSSLTPKEIAEKATNIIHFDAMEMSLTLKIIDKNGNTRMRKLKNTTKKFGSIVKTKIRFTSPADVSGTTILIHDNNDKDDDMWIYMPSLRNTRRIVSSDKGKSFMGSEFSNADMSKPNLNEYSYKLLGTETVNGKVCWKIESTFINKTSERNHGYKKRISYIEQQTYLTQKTDYYGTDGKLFKTMALSDYRKQPNGKYFAYTMKVENFKNNRKSEMTVNQFKPSTTAGERNFDVTNIEAD